MNILKDPIERAFIAIWSLCMISLAGWLTHLFWAIKVLTSSSSDAENVIAFIGFFPPIGALHDILIWVGLGL